MYEITSGGFCFKIIKGMFLHPFLIFDLIIKKDHSSSIALLILVHLLSFHNCTEIVFTFWLRITDIKVDNKSLL